MGTAVSVTLHVGLCIGYATENIQAIAAKKNLSGSNHAYLQAAVFVKLFELSYLCSVCCSLNRSIVDFLCEARDG